MRPGASPDACRAAYRRLVRAHHPDAHPDATGAERAAHAAALRQVVVAYEALVGPGQAVGPAEGGQAGCRSTTSSWSTATTMSTTSSTTWVPRPTSRSARPERAGCRQ